MTVCGAAVTVWTTTDVTTELDTTVVVDGDAEEEEATATGAGAGSSLGLPAFAMPAITTTPATAPAIHGHFLL